MLLTKSPYEVLTVPLANLLLAFKMAIAPCFVLFFFLWFHSYLSRSISGCRQKANVGCCRWPSLCFVFVNYVKVKSGDTLYFDIFLK